VLVSCERHDRQAAEGDRTEAAGKPWPPASHEKA
jgi:hypothetical protein